MVTHFLNEGHQPYRGWSPTIPRRVTHHQLDLEFDSSASQLVNLVASLAQLVSPSVALPAKLVTYIFFVNVFIFYCNFILIEVFPLILYAPYSLLFHIVQLGLG